MKVLNFTQTTPAIPTSENPVLTYDKTPLGCLGSLGWLARLSPIDVTLRQYSVVTSIFGCSRSDTIANTTQYTSSDDRLVQTILAILSAMSAWQARLPFCPLPICRAIWHSICYGVVWSILSIGYDILTSDNTKNLVKIVWTIDSLSTILLLSAKRFD